MTILNNSALRAQATGRVRQHPREARLLVLVYCGVIAALSLGSSGLNLLLDSRIGQTGGLDGMGMRTLLQTIQEVMYYVNFLFGPFWSAGFLYAMLRMVRGGRPEVNSLTEGFRRIGRILGHLAFQFLVVFGLLLAAVNLASVLFSFSSYGAEFAEMMMPVLEEPNLIAADGSVNLSVIPMEVIYKAAVPMLVLICVIFLPVYLYALMCFRMSLYLVMERSLGGVRAHFESARLMQGHKLQLLKLDLSYWWYYLLGIVISVAAYLDQILPLMGVELPFSPSVLYFLAMGLYCLLNLALSLWKKCEVDAAYVLAYEAIAYPEEPAGNQEFRMQTAE